MFRLFLRLLVLATAVVGLRADDRPLVFSTNTILHDLVLRVGGDSVRTQCLLPVGTDPHAFEPKPAEVRSVAKAGLVVANGLGFETWIAKVVRNSGFRGPVVHLATGITPLTAPGHGDHDHSTHDHHGHLDPHAWQDVRNVVRYVENLRQALVKLVPAEAAAIDARAAAYTKELEALHTWATETLARVPAERRKLVTSHDALAYLAHAYGLKIVPIAGLSPEQEPNARQFARLIDLIRAQKVPAIFIESTSNPKLAALLAREAGVVVSPSLYTDSIGAPNTPAGSYAGMMRHNIETIAAVLR